MMVKKSKKCDELKCCRSLGFWIVLMALTLLFLLVIVRSSQASLVDRVNTFQSRLSIFQHATHQEHIRSSSFYSVFQMKPYVEPVSFVPENFRALGRPVDKFSEEIRSLAQRSRHYQKPTKRSPYYTHNYEYSFTGLRVR